MAKRVGNSSLRVPNLLLAITLGNMTYVCTYDAAELTLIDDNYAILMGIGLVGVVCSIVVDPRLAPWVMMMALQNAGERQWWLEGG